MSLHYFGSNDWLKKYIECILPPNLDVLVSLFHKCIHKNPELVAAHLNKYIGKTISRSQYNDFIRALSSSDDRYWKAALFFHHYAQQLPW
jgi:hypothetical protein